MDDRKLFELEALKVEALYYHARALEREGTADDSSSHIADVIRRIRALSVGIVMPPVLGVEEP